MRNTTTPSHDLFHGVFTLEQHADGQSHVARRQQAPTVIPDPTGRLLKIATVDTSARAMCPSCDTTARGGFLSFVQDLRLAYACPGCKQLVWLPGA